MQLLLIGLIVILAVWLLVVTFLIYRQQSQYKVFTRGDKNLNIIELLKEQSDNLKLNQKNLEEISNRTNKLELESTLHIKKIGLHRYNPFRDTGGDQSFILSLIDSNDSGIVISALYSRSGTRWYAKKVVKGKGEEYELSKEEEKSISLAKHIKNP